MLCLNEKHISCIKSGVSSQKYLFAGIVKAGAQLRELDLSDNALGPVGVEGMVDFVETSACYKLEVMD